jgi:pyruvate/2-oxoglutarate dehydrogenase complex dihydrolipoamide dehydrogenase (E3) component
MDVDIAIVGGGAAGLGAAFAARRKGASVAIIERRRLGGDCTWAGCVPSKALISRAAEVWGGRKRGLTGDIDFPALMDEVAEAMRKIGEDESRPTLEAQGIAVLEGQATFTGPGRLDVDGTAVKAAKAVIIATGAVAVVPPIDGLAEAQPLTNDTIFELRTLPKRLAVMGGGPIGLELAQTFQRLGTHVTVIDGSRIAAKEEPEVSEVLMEVLSGEGVRFVVGSDVERVETRDGVHTLHTKDGASVEADTILAAVGRRPITDGLDLERGGVELTDGGFVKVDDKLRTTAPDVYAIGDVAGKLQFTHAGYQMGTIAVGNALGWIARSFDQRVIPWATFTDPEVGRVGLTEAQAAEAHGEQARVAYLPMAETDRGRATGKTAGFVKLIAGPRGPLGKLAGGSLLGATVVCPGGGDIVHEVAVLMQANAFAGRLAQTVHAYPSWSIAVRECAAQFFLSYRGREARPARRAS